MTWIDLIFDRTYADVQYAVAHRDNPEPNKGAYNNTDWNRVESAVRFLKSELEKRGYGGDKQIVTKVDWRGGDIDPDIPSEADTLRYLGNVRVLMDMYQLFRETPALPANRRAFTYISANNIERILHDIHELIKLMDRTVDIAWTMGMAHTGLFGGL